MSREALKLALEALESGKNHGVAIDVLRRALAEQPAQQEPVNKYCCHLCFNKSGQVFLDRMILCPECGNKRCPKATHHGLPCTKSNDLGQKGSIYDQPAQRTWVGLTDEEIINVAKSIDIEFKDEGLEAQIDDILTFARAIEAAHGIKENT